MTDFIYRVFSDADTAPVAWLVVALLVILAFTHRERRKALDATAAAIDRRVRFEARVAADVRRTLGTESARHLSEACEPSGDQNEVPVLARRIK